jgi:SAM-dependent methyltransferase
LHKGFEDRVAVYRSSRRSFKYQSAADWLYYFLSDALGLLLGRRYELPLKLRRGLEPYSKKRAEKYIRYFMELGNLKPDERVLDVGCGTGHLAIPLTKYLGRTGTYDGFDVVSDCIDWCKTNVASKYPNFHFTHVDVFNRAYNLNGKLKATEFSFPYGDRSFDFVFLRSVFTHMLPEEMENYFREIARVLKVGGRCLITFLLLNEESLQLIKAGRSVYDLKHEGAGYRMVDLRVPERVVGYNEDFIRALYEKCQLTITEPIHYGLWCERETYLDRDIRQDIVVASKR